MLIELLAERVELDAPMHGRGAVRLESDLCDVGSDELFEPPYRLLTLAPTLTTAPAHSTRILHRLYVTA